ncbi:hypothetical protein AAHB34_03285 [Paenarthrobacter ureafaciens]
MDGLRIRNGEPVLESAVYTYNQGPVLGALLELGGAVELERASRLIEAIGRGLTLPGTGVVRCEGTGDGGLFTGILLRYLALAARDARLPESTRSTARDLVLSTAEALWTGRSERTPDGHGSLQAPPHLLFRSTASGRRNISGGVRRRTFHPTSGLDGTGSGRNAGLGELRHAILV